MTTPTEQLLRDRLIGDWELVSMVVLGEDGSRTEMWGENPNGQLSYSAAGRMFIGSAFRDRPVLGDGATAQDEAEAYRSCVAYWGTYDLQAEDGAEDGVVTHYPIGSSMQSYVGAVEPRKFRFDGDLLHIQRHPEGRIRTIFRRIT